MARSSARSIWALTRRWSGRSQPDSVQFKFKFGSTRARRRSGGGGAREGAELSPDGSRGELGAAQPRGREEKRGEEWSSHRTAVEARRRGELSTEEHGPEEEESRRGGELRTEQNSLVQRRRRGTRVERGSLPTVVGESSDQLSGRAAEQKRKGGRRRSKIESLSAVV